MKKGNIYKKLCFLEVVAVLICSISLYVSILKSNIIFVVLTSSCIGANIGLLVYRYKQWKRKGARK